MQEWKRLEDVDPWVQEAASLYATVAGASVDYVASYMGKSEKLVKAAFEHPVVKAYVQKLQFRVLQKQSELTEELSEIRSTSISRINECLPEASIKDAIAALKLSAEIHPDRAFVKMEKREEKHTHSHQVSGNLLEELKQRHLVAVKPAIQVEAHVVEDDTEGEE